MINHNQFILERIIKELPGHIYWKDKNGVYMGCNDAQAKSLGLKSRQEILGKTDFDLSEKSIAETYRKNDLEVMITGKIKTVEEECYIGDQEVMVLSKKVPLRNNKNEIVGILGVSLDIDYLKKEKSKLATEKKFAEITLEHIIAHMPGHVYWKDENGTYLGCNDRQAQSLGLEKGQDILGKNDSDLPWKDQAPKIREADLRVTNGESITVEEAVLLVNGKNAIFLSKKEPLRDVNNHIIGILGVSLDITKIKQYQEKLRKANQAKSEFLRIMSHELTAPLSNVINSLDRIAQLADSANFDKKTLNEYLKLAKQEAEIVRPKLNDVINYINFDENDIIDNKTSCKLLQLIENLVEKNSAKKIQDVIIDTKIDPTLPAQVSLNTEYLYTVLNIILNNALKYTKKGNVTLQLEKTDGIQLASSQPIDNLEFIKITVRDTGPGIYETQLQAMAHDFSKEAKDKVFSQYRKPSVRLPYAKLLVHYALQGQLTIESTINVGTAVIITIPYEKVENNSLQHKQKPQQPLQVLLIEDNEVSRQLEGELLKELKCHIVEAATGEEAIAKAKNQHFDFIFLDITLPDMNGLEVFEQLQTTICADTPVIALTSHSTEEDIDIFTDKGILTVIPKPINLVTLKAFFNDYERSLDE